MIRGKPLMGVGLGAYETAYPIYSQDDGAIALGRSYAVDRAHNDYLQLVAEGGIVGGVLALWFIVSIFRAVVRGAQAAADDAGLASSPRRDTSPTAATRALTNTPS